MILNNLLSDFTFAAALGRKRTVRQHHTDFAIWRKMIDHMLQPCKVGVSSRRRSILPALILCQFIRAPIGEIERRICHDEICTHGRVQIFKKCVCRILSQIGINAANSKVHLCHLPSGCVGFLTINRDIINVPRMVFNELCALNKHTAGTTARIVYAPLKRLQNLNQRPNNTGRRIEFTAAFSFLLCKHG